MNTSYKVTAVRQGRSYDSKLTYCLQTVVESHLRTFRRNLSHETRRSLSSYSDPMKCWCGVTMKRNKLSPLLLTDDERPKITLDCFGLYQSIGLKLFKGPKQWLAPRRSDLSL